MSGISSVGAVEYLSTRLQPVTAVARPDAVQINTYRNPLEITSTDSVRHTLLLRDTVDEISESLAIVQITDDELRTVGDYLTKIQAKLNTLTKASSAEAEILKKEIKELEDAMSAYLGQKVLSRENPVLENFAKVSGQHQRRFFEVVGNKDYPEIQAEALAAIEVNLNYLIKEQHDPSQCPMCQSSRSLKKLEGTSVGTIPEVTEDGKGVVAIDPVEALLIGSKWNVAEGENLTYSFYQDPTIWFAYEEAPSFVSPIGDIEERLDEAFRSWNSVAGLSLQKVNEKDGQVGAIRSAFTDSFNTEGAVAFSYQPGTTAGHGDIFYNYEQFPSEDFTVGSFAYYTALHEIGHALGLSHTHQDEGGSYFGKELNKSEDTIRNSVMSYGVEDRNTVLVEKDGQLESKTIYASTPMRYDIQAMEALYGKSTTSNVGDTVYQWADRVQTLETIYDSDGIDTLDASNQTQEVHVNLQPGSFQSIGIWSEDEQVQHYVDKGYGDKQTMEQFIDVLNAGAKDARALYTGEDNVAIAYSSYIENAIGGQSDDVIIGNDLDNVLKGNAGDDLLIGGRGYDTAVYDGKRQDYKIEQNLDTSYSVTNLRTKEVDSLKEIENVQFRDEEFFIASGDVKNINIQNETQEKSLDLKMGNIQNLKKYFITKENLDPLEYNWKYGESVSSEFILRRGQTLNINISDISSGNKKITSNTFQKDPFFGYTESFNEDGSDPFNFRIVDTSGINLHHYGFLTSVGTNLTTAVGDSILESFDESFEAGFLTINTYNSQYGLIDIKAVDLNLSHEVMWPQDTLLRNSSSSNALEFYHKYNNNTIEEVILNTNSLNEYEVTSSKVFDVGNSIGLYPRISDTGLFYQSSGVLGSASFYDFKNEQNYAIASDRNTDYWFFSGDRDQNGITEQYIAFGYEQNSYRPSKLRVFEVDQDKIFETPSTAWISRSGDQFMYEDGSVANPLYSFNLSDSIDYGNGRSSTNNGIWITQDYHIENLTDGLNFVVYDKTNVTGINMSADATILARVNTLSSEIDIQQFSFDFSNLEESSKPDFNSSSVYNTQSISNMFGYTNFREDSFATLHYDKGASTLNENVTLYQGDVTSDGKLLVQSSIDDLPVNSVVSDSSLDWSDYKNNRFLFDPQANSYDVVYIRGQGQYSSPLTVTAKGSAENSLAITYNNFQTFDIDQDDDGFASLQLHATAGPTEFQSINNSFDYVDFGVGDSVFKLKIVPTNWKPSSEPTVPVSPGEAKGYTPIIFTNARLNLSAFPSLANFNIPQTILDSVLAVLEGREAEPHGLIGEDLNDPEALLNLIKALQATITEVDAQRAALGSVAGTLDERMQVVAASQSGDISAEAADSPVVAATLLELIKAQIQSLIDEQLTALSNISEPVALELLNND